MEKRCPGASEWNVIAQDENSILFEWRSKPCPASDEHQIARIFHGKHNWFALLYTAKVYELAPDTREQWIKTLGAATIDTETTAVGSEDVDIVIPFEMAKVMAALKPAMESADCNVKDATATRVECKDPRNTTGYNGYGGESVTAVL